MEQFLARSLPALLLLLLSPSNAEVYLFENLSILLCLDLFPIWPLSDWVGQRLWRAALLRVPRGTDHQPLGEISLWLGEKWILIHILSSWLPFYCLWSLTNTKEHSREICYIFLDFQNASHLWWSASKNLLIQISMHDNHHEDRRWGFECIPLSNFAFDTCSWTG